MVTWSVDGGQVPLVMVHWKILAPTLNPVTEDVGELGVVMLPVPETKVQIPLPIEGTFPAKELVEEHIV